MASIHERARFNMKDFLAIFLISALIIAVSVLCFKLWFDWVMGLSVPFWFKFMLLAKEA
nr:MAG TPA: hypothetical protein [Caudoviricetes sp.]